MLERVNRELKRRADIAQKVMYGDHKCLKQLIRFFFVFFFVVLLTEVSSEMGRHLIIMAGY